MPNKILKTQLFVLLALIFLVGCKTTKDVKVKAFIDERERVDMEKSGNAGYIFGEPKEDKRYVDKTKEIIVVEFSREAKEEDAVKKTIKDENVQEGPKTTSPSSVSGPQSRKKAPEPQVEEIVIPNLDDIKLEKKQTPVAQAAEGFVEYTVEKDDTLQKISKKFYNSNNKWMKIYEANKDVIENPDFIKPGITIRIPQGVK